MKLIPPKSTVLYDYPLLSHCISVWHYIESGASWSGEGYAKTSPMHRNATSSRQFDSSSGVLNDQLESSTATIVGVCLAKLEEMERCIILYAEIGTTSTWVEHMEPTRAQMRYEEALISLAAFCRRDGIGV